MPNQSHRKSPNHFEELLRHSDVKAVFYIRWHVASSPSAYQRPFLDTRCVSVDKMTELLLLVKPVPMWAALFSLLEASPSAVGTTSAISSEADLVTLESQIRTASTPAKRPPSSDYTLPPSLVLAALLPEASDADFRANVTAIFLQFNKLSTASPLRSRKCAAK